MYEKYTNQALPSKEYRELVGSAICVFNSNNSFIIENILRNDTDNKYNWYDLIDEPSGNLDLAIKNTISRNSNKKIATLFDNIVGMRNRIVHSYQCTNNNGEQTLFTKNKRNIQFEITEKYLYDFIVENEKLSDQLHKFRGY